MSDVDYQKLFENGQLVWQEPSHVDYLHRFYQSFKGYPEEQIFKSKYQGYLNQFHPEDLLQVPVPPPEEKKVEVSLPVDLIVPEVPADVVPLSDEVIQENELTDEEVDAALVEHGIKVHHLAGPEKRRQAVLDFLSQETKVSSQE